MHTVGPKRVQMSEKDGCRTELRPRVGPSLNRNGANLAGGASPFAGKGKGKGVELGKPQQLGNHEPTSGFDVNLGKSTSGRLSKGRLSAITSADPCLLHPTRSTCTQVLNAFSPTRPVRPLSNRPPILFHSRPTPLSHLSFPPRCPRPPVLDADHVSLPTLRTQTARAASLRPRQRTTTPTIPISCKLPDRPCSARYSSCSYTRPTSSRHLAGRARLTTSMGPVILPFIPQGMRIYSKMTMRTRTRVGMATAGPEGCLSGG